MQTGCQQNRAWQAAGLEPISVAINVSAKQFQNPLFVDSIRAGLEESGMDARHLVLELTESMIMSNPAETASMLGAIKRMGARISIDDFGRAIRRSLPSSAFPSTN